MKCKSCGTNYSAPAGFDPNDVVCPNCSPVFRGDMRCLCGKHSFIEWERPMGVSRKSPFAEIVPQVNRVLADLRSAGKLDSILPICGGMTR